MCGFQCLPASQVRKRRSGSRPKGQTDPELPDAISSTAVGRLRLYGSVVEATGSAEGGEYVRCLDLKHGQ